MRQGPNPKRSRGRNNNNNGGNGGGRRPNLPLRMQTFDSNGPDVRIRGSAFQVHEKYLQLARDASSSGDRIIAESYLQHAEHYYRIIAAAQEQQQLQQQNDPNRRFRNEGGYNGQDYRGGQSGDEFSGEGGDEFPGEDMIDASQQRFDSYVRPAQQDNRYQGDSRSQPEGRYQDPGARPQPEVQARGVAERNQSDSYRNQGGEPPADGQRPDRQRHEGRSRFDRDGQRRRGPDGLERNDYAAQPRPQPEEPREIRNFEAERPPVVEAPQPERQLDGHAEMPAPATQVAAEPPSPSAEAAPPRPRRGRPRRVVAPPPESPAEPAAES